MYTAGNLNQGQYSQNQSQNQGAQRYDNYGAKQGNYQYENSNGESTKCDKCMSCLKTCG